MLAAGSAMPLATARRRPPSTRAAQGRAAPGAGGCRGCSSRGLRAVSATRGSLPMRRLTFARSACASGSENVASRMRPSGWVRDQMHGAMQRNDGLPRAGGSRYARRPGVVARDELSLLGMQEDRPLVPRRIEGAFQLLDARHDAEAPLGIGMRERVGYRPPAAPAAACLRWRARGSLRPPPRADAARGRAGRPRLPAGRRSTTRKARRS